MMELFIFVSQTDNGLWRWYVYNEFDTVLDEGVAKSQGWALRRAKQSRNIIHYDVTGEWVTNET